MSHAYQHLAQLFSEFTSFSRQDWLAALQGEIDDASLQRYLDGRTYESLSLRPLYTHEDAPAQAASWYNTNSGWQYHQYLMVMDGTQPETLRALLHQALSDGARGADVHWYLSTPMSVDFAQTLLPDVPGGLPLALYGQPGQLPIAQEAMAWLWSEAVPVTLYLSPALQPAAEQPAFAQLSAWRQHQPPSFTALGISSLPFANQGSTTVQEMAFTLSYWVDCLDVLSDQGWSMEDLLTHTECTLATHGHFYLNLARFRAMRVLLAEVVAAYGISAPPSLTLKAVSSLRNKTVYDPVSNMLRNTSEALGAVLGGCDRLSLLPHDYAHHPNGAMGARMARNVSNLLLHEAHLDKVEDPLAGAYFLETLTQQLITQAWALFQAMEARGGYHQLCQQGWIAQQMAQARQQKSPDIRTRKQALVGVSRYVNAQETIEEASLTLPPEAAHRLAGDVEQLRWASDRYFLQRGERPAVELIIFPEGQSVALINARKAFILDLLHSAGLQANVTTYDSAKAFAPPFALPSDQGSEWITFDKSSSFSLPGATDDVWILCGTPAFYQQQLPALLNNWLAQLPSTPAVYLAGKPVAGKPVAGTPDDEAQYQGFIYEGADMVALLSDILKRKNIRA